MKVYVVLSHIDYEGNDLEAVFSTREKANKWISEKDVFIARLFVKECTVDVEVRQHTEPLNTEAEQREPAPPKEYGRNETLRRLVE